jgi:hypothetical protein
MIRVAYFAYAGKKRDNVMGAHGKAARHHRNQHGVRNSGLRDYKGIIFIA